ncbi:MAG: hypothetical protein ACLR23_09785 [Clostridia bacterium]
MKLLYAEDEISMSEAVVDILTYHHYSVDRSTMEKKLWPMRGLNSMTASYLMS